MTCIEEPVIPCSLVRSLVCTWREADARLQDGATFRFPVGSDCGLILVSRAVIASASASHRGEEYVRVPILLIVVKLPLILTALGDV